MNLYLEVNSSDLIDDAKKLSLELNLQLIESQEKNNEDYFFVLSKERTYLRKGLSPSSNLFYDVSLHLGTLIAVCAYFKNEIKDTFNQINVQKSIFSNNLLTNLFISSLPTLFLGFLFVNFIDNNLRNTLVISVTTIFFALVLWIATLRAPRKNELAEISLNEALIIGLAQSISLIPGTSRSGVTISAGLLLGLDTKTATKFSFLMSIPTIGAKQKIWW